MFARKQLFWISEAPLYICFQTVFEHIKNWWCRKIQEASVVNNAWTNTVKVWEMTEKKDKSLLAVDIRKG